MAFANDNVAMGLPRNSKFLVGVSNVDTDETVEEGIDLPWASDPIGSYVYYDCTVGVMLDSGIVVHSRLPQIDRLPDSLSSTTLDAVDFATISNKGVNLTCQDQFTDIVQRMGHSRYWFRLWGQALRIGYKVPIPGIKKIGGADAIPYDQNVQFAFNRIFPNCNYGGVVLWHAQWSLWYTIALPPTNQTIPVASPFVPPALVTNPPKSIQVPFSEADASAKPSVPGGLEGTLTKSGR